MYVFEIADVTKNKNLAAWTKGMGINTPTTNLSYPYLKLFSRSFFHFCSNYFPLWDEFRELLNYCKGEKGAFEFFHTLIDDETG